MKKKILLSVVPIIAISSPILIASSCDNTTKDDYFEKRAKETDEEIEKRYINEYIQKENYIFDDFEQFKFNKEKHFRKNVDPNVLTLKETSKDNWTCKEYNKNGSFKRNIENGKAYVAVNNNHHGNFWINMFLGAWTILTQTH